MKRRNKLLSMILPLAFAMAMLIGMTVTANADTVTVKYLYYKNEAAAIAGETTQGTQDCVRVESSTNDFVYWGEGNTTTWLVVDGDAEISGHIYVKGFVNLIISDGKTLNVNNGIDVIDGAELNIYAQSIGNNAGQLVSSSQSHSGGIAVYDNSKLTVNGGKIDARGKYWGIGDYDPRASKRTSVITINGGTVTARPTTYESTDSDQKFIGILTGRSLKVNGGEVTAEWIGTGSNKYGIYSGESLTVNGGKVTADGQAPGCTGIYTLGKVTVTGGELYASCEQPEPAANDTESICARGGMTVTGGKVTATNGYYGIWVPGNGTEETTIITGGTVDATGTLAGIFSQELLKIEGGVVNANAAGGNGSGIACYNDILISGGDVRTTGGDTGIRILSDNKALTISGGNVVTSGKACIAAENITIGDGLTVRAGEKEPGDYVDSSDFQTTARNYKWAKIGNYVTRNVRFFVVNGAWNDGTKSGMTVSMTGFDDEMILTADDIPAVGSKPDSGYKEGSWDVTPVAGTLITENKTYTYTYAKKDEPAPAPSNTARTVLVAKAIASGNTKAKVSWNNAGADRYVIYYAKCGRSLKKYKTVNGKTRSVTVSKLRKRSQYKFRVLAQKKSGKSYKTIATSAYAHMAAGNVCGRYTNVKDLKVNRSAVNLGKGRSFTIKTSLTKVKKNKRLFNLSHDPSVRFITSDPGVAAVSSKGKITAKGTGTCYIYVQAVNGIWKTVKVTVR